MNSKTIKNSKLNGTDCKSAPTGAGDDNIFRHADFDGAGGDGVAGGVLDDE